MYAWVFSWAQMCILDRKIRLEHLPIIVEQAVTIHMQRRCPGFAWQSWWRRLYELFWDGTRLGEVSLKANFARPNTLAWRSALNFPFSYNLAGISAIPRLFSWLLSSMSVSFIDLWSDASSSYVLQLKSGIQTSHMSCIYLSIYQ